MGKKADPAEGLEPDITTIEDVKEREAQQLEYYGGDPIDDDEDLSAEDRGDNILPDELMEDRGDEITETEKEEEDEDSEAADDEAAEEDDSGDTDDEADSESSVAGDDDSDEEVGDDGDDDDGEVDDDDVEPDDPPKSDQRVPLSRFNEINERRKEAERQLQELQSKETATEEASEDKFDFDTAEEEYMELLLDGKTKEAGAKRREIRAAESVLFKNEAKSETLEDVNQAQDLRLLNDLSMEAEQLYPEFNEGHPDYNPQAAAKVITYMKGYAADGQSASNAFVSGLADVIAQYGLDDTQSGEEDTQDEDPKPEVKKKAGIKKTKEKLKVAKQQGSPAALAGQGGDSAGAVVPDIENMTDEEYDALPESTRARMRGDVL